MKWRPRLAGAVLVLEPDRVRLPWTRQPRHTACHRARSLSAPSVVTSKASDDTSRDGTFTTKTARDSSFFDQTAAAAKLFPTFSIRPIAIRDRGGARLRNALLVAYRRTRAFETDSQVHSCGPNPTPSMGKKDRRAPAKPGEKKRELPQAAPTDDAELEPDEDDVAFVNAHRAYGAFFGTRLSVDGIAGGDSTSRKRRKEVKEEDRTAEFERGGPRVVDGDDDENDDGEKKTLALPVKRLDGTVVHQPTGPASIELDELELGNLSAAARAAVEKARESWDDGDHGVDDDGKKVKGKKSRRALELAEEMQRTEYGQKKSEKWWDGNDKDGNDGAGDENDTGKQSDDEDKEDDQDVDPATAARRSRAAAAAASEAEMSFEEKLVSIRERIGVACQGVLEDPESRWHELEEVLTLAEDRDPTIARLGALSAVLVFADVVPGYRIRPLTEKELTMKVTKETQKLRDFEAGLLKMYKGFVRLVVRRGGGEKKTRALRGGGFGLAPGVGLTCLCQLLQVRIGLTLFDALYGVQ